MKPVRIAIGIVAVAITGALFMALPAGADDAPPVVPEVVPTTEIPVPTIPEVTVPPTTAPPVTLPPTTEIPPVTFPDPIVVTPERPEVEQLECMVGHVAGIVTIPDIDGLLYSEHGFTLPTGQYGIPAGTGAIDVNAATGYIFPNGSTHKAYTFLVREVPKCEQGSEPSVPPTVPPAGPAGPQGPAGPPGAPAPGHPVPIADLPTLRVTPAAATSAQLPHTGSNATTTLIVIGACLLVLGGLAMAGRRRLYATR